MNELSLFTGAGGGLLGTKLLGWNPIGYVEWDDYCQRVIAARIRDGFLPNAPIFGDIRTFIDSGCAELYRGITDVITGGFPCQPFSVAGKQKGADDERNMWPATATVVGIVKPRFVLFENVPGIRKYLPVVVRDLRRLGYEVSKPLILGADDVGAPHRRKRVWIVAHNGLRKPMELPGSLKECRNRISDSGQDVADSIGDGSGSRRSKCEGQ
jgi:DNA (cytosine-5)-methyltransferase 1